MIKKNGGNELLHFRSIYLLDSLPNGHPHSVSHSVKDFLEAVAKKTKVKLHVEHFTQVDVKV
jgi:hypothetical protein